MGGGGGRVVVQRKKASPELLGSINVKEGDPEIQQLRIGLAMQGTPAGSLVQEDPTCHRETKPVRHNY